MLLLPVLRPRRLHTNTSYAKGYAIRSNVPSGGGANLGARDGGTRDYDGDDANGYVDDVRDGGGHDGDDGRGGGRDGAHGVRGVPRDDGRHLPWQ